jgi:hypothetical protein
MNATSGTVQGTWRRLIEAHVFTGPRTSRRDSDCLNARTRSGMATLPMMTAAMSTTALASTRASSVVNPARYDHSSSRLEWTPYAHR